jgi:uncharacterized protein with LGFP repeats
MVRSGPSGTRSEAPAAPWASRSVRSSPRCSPQRAPNAWAVYGRIFEAYRDSGSEEAWGFPTMDERAAANGPDGTPGRYQYFEDALFLWSAPGDARVVSGPIHDAFAEGGREAALGYPLEDAVVEGDGLRQRFQSATIHWNPEEGAWIE